MPFSRSRSYSRACSAWHWLCESSSALRVCSRSGYRGRSLAGNVESVMRPLQWITVGSMMILPAPHVLAQPTGSRIPSNVPSTGSVWSQSEDAVRALDEKFAQHERAARRALSGICEGCTAGWPSRARRIMPREQVGEDGLAFRPEDLL
jgi:hypothetical protein